MLVSSYRNQWEKVLGALEGIAIEHESTEVGVDWSGLAYVGLEEKSKRNRVQKPTLDTMIDFRQKMNHVTENTLLYWFCKCQFQPIEITYLHMTDTDYGPGDKLGPDV